MLQISKHYHSTSEELRDLCSTVFTTLYKRCWYLSKLHTPVVNFKIRQSNDSFKFLIFVKLHKALNTYFLTNAKKQNTRTIIFTDVILDFLMTHGKATKNDFLYKHKKYMSTNPCMVVEVPSILISSAFVRPNNAIYVC